MEAKIEQSLRKAINLYQSGNIEQAKKICATILEVAPNSATLNNITGAIHHSDGQLQNAIKFYEHATALQSDYSDAFYNLGNAHKDMRNFEKAIVAYRKALQINPNLAEAQNNMGIAHMACLQTEEAIVCYERALLIRPDYAEAFNNLANALKGLGDLGGAMKAVNQAMRIKPKNPEFQLHSGIISQAIGNIEHSIESYRTALSLSPDFAEAHKAFSYALLNDGKIAEGLEEYEWRWKCDSFQENHRDFSKPTWDGSASLKDKTILLWDEQGIGDTVNWSAYVPIVRSLSKHTILECQDKLVPLLSRSFPNVEVRAFRRGIDKVINDFDCHLPLGSLLHRLQNNLPKNHRRTSFLTPDPLRVDHWRDRLKSVGRGPYVGINWKSSNMATRRLPNYAPLSDWAPVFNLTNVTFINLQYSDFQSDLENIHCDFGVKVYNFDDLDHLNNVDDASALMAALDCVVSTIGAVPLISAGLGTHTKLVNWRQSVWNNVLHQPCGPSVEIYERNTWEPWDAVFTNVAKSIVELPKTLL